MLFRGQLANNGDTIWIPGHGIVAVIEVSANNTLQVFVEGQNQPFVLTGDVARTIATRLIDLVEGNALAIDPAPPRPTP